MGKEKGAGKNAMVIKTRGFYLHSELPVVELKKKKIVVVCLRNQLYSRFQG